MWVQVLLYKLGMLIQYQVSEYFVTVKVQNAFTLYM